MGGTMCGRRPEVARLLAFLVLALAFAAARAQEADAAHQAEANLLLDFKATLVNGEQILKTWVNGTDHCAWSGVNCNTDGFVERLSLAELGITAQIPQPNGWVLPDGIQVLELGVNNITGPIPPKWKLPSAMNTLYFNNNPLNSTLSADWILPDALAYWLMENCGLYGPLPDGWKMPAKLQSMNFANNRLSGTLPKEFWEVPTLQVMGLQNNSLSGPFPTSYQFNTSFEIYGLGISGNNFSGPVFEWKDLPKAMVEIFPGNAGLCGPVPATGPQLITTLGLAMTDTVKKLPACTSSGLSTGAIVGIAIGSVAGVAVVLGAVVWLVKRRRNKPPTDELKDLSGGKTLGDVEMGSAMQESLAPSQPGSFGTAMYNPFKGGPHSDVSAGMGSGSSQHVSIAAAASILRANSSSGGTLSSAHSAQLRAKLEQMQLDPPAWLINPQQLVLDQGPDGRLVLLGRGSFGRVYRGWLHPSPPLPDGGSGASNGGAPPVPVAIKVIDAGDINAFLREAHIMERLRGSPQVVPLHGACIVQEQLIVVMELLEGGDLGAALTADLDGTLSWKQQGKQVALDIATGLAYLHANNVTHRDLKSKNVLLTNDLRAKVADVGGAAMHSATYMSADSSNFGGTLAWAAPELLMGAPCTQKIDIFSLGVVLWEIATHKVPQRGHVRPPPASEDCPQALGDLIAECLQQDPKLRPSAQDVLDRLQQI